MLNVLKEDKGSSLLIRLVGSVDEEINLESSIGPVKKPLEIYCKDVVRINSVGVKIWVRYFQKLQETNVPLKFYELSSVLVQQLNLMVNFIPPSAQILSVCAPYLCTACKANSLGLFNVADLKGGDLVAPKLKCPKCGGVSEFDDIESDYFGFAGRRK